MKTRYGSSLLDTLLMWDSDVGPRTSEFLTQHPSTKAGLATGLFIALLTTRMGAVTFRLFPQNVELGAVVATTVSSLLIGFIYLGIPLTAIVTKSHRGLGKIARFGRAAGVIFFVSLVIVGLGEALQLPILMACASLVLVLSAVAVSAFVGARAMLRLMKYSGI